MRPSGGNSVIRVIPDHHRQESEFVGNAFFALQNKDGVLFPGGQRLAASLQTVS